MDCLLKPMNPVLGESTRIVHEVQPTHPALTSVTEQVSHHPSVTAFACYDPATLTSFYGHVDITPRFMGLSVKCDMSGTRSLTLTLPDGVPEEYEISNPALEWHLFPKIRSNYTGPWWIRCSTTGLAAELHHCPSSLIGLRSRSRMEGCICSLAEGHLVSPALLTIAGEFDGVVILRDTRSHLQRVLWDAAAAGEVERASPLPQRQDALEARPAQVVWRHVFDALQREDYPAAHAAKVAVEEEERAKRRERAAAGVVWAPRWFERVGERWVPRM